MNTGWMGWILSGIVLILVFSIVALLKNPVKLLATGERAEAIVVTMATLVGSPGQDSLKAPVFEFKDLSGVSIRISSRSFTAFPSLQIEDKVPVAYDPSNPQNAQLLVLKEFVLIGIVLGFLALVILLWISGILISGDPSMEDPFHLLPMVISNLKLNPVRFPALFILSLAIPACGLGTYLTYQRANDYCTKGLKAVGIVEGAKSNYSRLNDGDLGRETFPMIAFEDATGNSHIIRRALAKPLSRLQPGDKVEVVYLANHPDRGIVNTWDELWPPPIFFGLMMMAFIFAFRLVIKNTI